MLTLEWQEFSVGFAEGALIINNLNIDNQINIISRDYLFE